MLHGVDGIQQWHAYGIDQLDEARAHYEKLGAEAPTRIENAATRVEDRHLDAWRARDWDRFAALFPPGFRITERRRLIRLEYDRERLLETLRPMFEMTSSITFKVLATR